jgi:hypothetical protein
MERSCVETDFVLFSISCDLFVGAVTCPVFAFCSCNYTDVRSCSV